MKKNDLFTFTAPNGVEVTGVVLHVNMIHEDNDGMVFEHICYAQNRLFTYAETYRRENAFTEEEAVFTTESCYGKVLVDYAILPDYDAMLEAYSDHQVTLAEEQSGM